MDDDHFDLIEFKESYAHYRHLEEERSRHLKFFLTMVGGLLGFLGFLAKGDKPITDWGSLLFVCGLVVIFLQILDTITFAAIRHVGDARARHSKTIRYLRGKLTSDKFVANLWEDFDHQAHISAQDSALWTLHLFALVFVLAAVTISIYTLSSGVIVCWLGAVLLVLTLVFAAVHIGVSVWLKVPKKNTI
jgi:cytochrome bd-type quinol oxidase subunit 2